MTNINLIEKRKKYLAQRINKLKEMEASLNVQERKKRTRNLIERGGLIAKAGLNEWSYNTLLGGLLFLKEQETNTSTLEVWSYRGGSAFASAKQSKDQHLITNVIVKFASHPAEDIKTSLKSLGLEWNALRQEWEGYTKVNELKELIEKHKATVTALESSF